MKIKNSAKPHCEDTQTQECHNLRDHRDQYFEACRHSRLGLDRSELLRHLFSQHSQPIATTNRCWTTLTKRQKLLKCYHQLYMLF